MKKSILITVLSVAVAFAGYSQSNKLQGPAYKNAKPEVKYDGNTSLLIRVNPNQFQGPEFKNFDASKYQIEILDSDNELQLPANELIVSSDSAIYSSAATEENEKIIYRRVKTNDMEGKNTKGLKGPAYKNYKP